MAGSRNVYELHGSVHRNICTRCGAVYTLAQLMRMDAVPVCPVCGGRVKPDVVLYEESARSGDDPGCGGCHSPRGPADRRGHIADGVSRCGFSLRIPRQPAGADQQDAYAARRHRQSGDSRSAGGCVFQGSAEGNGAATKLGLRQTLAAWNEVPRRFSMSKNPFGWFGGPQPSKCKANPATCAADSQACAARFPYGVSRPGSPWGERETPLFDMDRKCGCTVKQGLRCVPCLRA